MDYVSFMLTVRVLPASDHPDQLRGLREDTWCSESSRTCSKSSAPNAVVRFSVSNLQGPQLGRLARIVILIPREPPGSACGPVSSSIRARERHRGFPWSFLSLSLPTDGEHGTFRNPQPHIDDRQATLETPGVSCFEQACPRQVAGRHPRTFDPSLVYRPWPGGRLKPHKNDRGTLSSFHVRPRIHKSDAETLSVGFVCSHPMLRSRM